MSKVAPYFDEMVDLIASGTPATVAAKMYSVDFRTVKAFADADPDRSERWRAAVWGREHKAFVEGFEECVRRIAAGEFLDAVRRDVFGDRLTKSGFNKYLRKDPERAARWRAVSAARDRKHPSAGVSAKYTAADFEIMLLALECCAVEPSSRERHALRGERDRNPDFAARYQMMLDRRVAIRRRVWAVMSAATAARKARTVRPLGQLRRDLMLNELYAAARSVVDREISRADYREDIASELVLGVLDGRFTLDGMPKEAKKLLYSGAVVDWNVTRSTDETFTVRGAPMSLLDAMTPSGFSFEDASC